MQTVVLGYTGGSVTASMSFPIYRLWYLDVDFERVLHVLLSGGYREDIVGYRTRTKIEFMPLAGDRVRLAFLYGFMAGTNRTIVAPDFGTRVVEPVDSPLAFAFVDNILKADGFTLEFTDLQVQTVADDGSTRVLKPTYTPGGDAAVGTYYVSLVNDQDAKPVRKYLQFSGGDRGDSVLGYLHTPVVDFGRIETDAKRAWLRDYLLWGKKQLDTTLIDPVNGTVYDVVSLDAGMRWQMIQGVKNTWAIKIRLAEKDSRTTTETPVVPPVSGDVLISDQGTSDVNISD